MSRDYVHEDWIPWYTRATAGWLDLSLAARGVAVGIAMLMGRDGEEIPLGSRGLRGLTRVLGCSWEALEPALHELLGAGPDGEPPRLVHDVDRRVLRDPEALRRRRPTSTERVRSLRQRRSGTSQRETDETVSPVSSCCETGGCVPSTLISSDLISEKIPEEIPSAREPLGRPSQTTAGTVRFDLPLTADAEAVWATQTMLRDAGKPIEVVWAAFCGHFAEHNFGTRNGILGKWQKWVVEECGRADHAREDARKKADREARWDRQKAGPGTLTEPAKIDPEVAAKATAEFMASVRKIRGGGA